MLPACSQDADIEPEVVKHESIEDESLLQIVPANQRRRTCQKRPKTEREVRLGLVRKLLARFGVSYAKWQAAHWAQSGSKKAAACPDGKFTDLQSSQLTAETRSKIECPACRSLLRESGFWEQDIETYLENGLQEDAENEDANEDLAAEAPPPCDEEDKLDEDDEDTDMKLDRLARRVSVCYEAGECRTMILCNIWTRQGSGHVFS